MFTALAASSKAISSHNAEGKSRPKSDNPFANEVKDLETQVESKINKQLKQQQV